MPKIIITIIFGKNKTQICFQHHLNLYYRINKNEGIKENHDLAEKFENCFRSALKSNGIPEEKLKYGGQDHFIPVIQIKDIEQFTKVIQDTEKSFNTVSAPGSSVDMAALKDPLKFEFGKQLSFKDYKAMKEECAQVIKEREKLNPHSIFQGTSAIKEGYISREVSSEIILKQCLLEQQKSAASAESSPLLKKSMPDPEEAASSQNSKQMPDPKEAISPQNQEQKLSDKPLITFGFSSGASSLSSDFSSGDSSLSLQSPKNKKRKRENIDEEPEYPESGESYNNLPDAENPAYLGNGVISSVSKKQKTKNSEEPDLRSFFAGYNW